MATIPDLFLSTLNRYKDKTAVVDGERRATYGTLDLIVRSLSSFLISRGIGHGDKVAILLPNSLEFITSFFSVASLGAVALPLNVAYKAEEIRFYVSDSQIKLLITEERLKPIDEKVTAGLAVSVVVVRGGKREWSFLEADTPAYIKASIKPDDDALYLYSTGSTGRPKRVARTHFNLTALAHTYGFGNFISAVKVGASIYVLEGFNRNKVADLIERESITIFPAVQSFR